MALSVSCCLGTEISVPDSNRFGEPSSGRWGAGDLRVSRMRGGGTVCAAGSHPSDADDSAEGGGTRVIGSVEGADVDKDVPAVSVFEKKPYWCNHFWAKCYCVDTAGLDAGMIRKYVRYQEEKEQQFKQLQLCDLGL
jgi:hypothetical protein